MKRRERRSPPGSKRSTRKRKEVRRYIQLLRRFLEWPESPQRKAEIVRKAAWRWFPDDVDAPLAQLRNVLSLIESADTPVTS